MNRQNESSAEATTENIENKLDPNTPEILESKREKNSKEHVSNLSRLDIECYIFKDSKLIKKKKKVYTDVTRPPKVRPKKSNFGGRYFYVKIQL